MMRLEGGQVSHFAEILNADYIRTDHFASHKTLGNDSVGYKVIQLLAILTHPCQKCAEDPNAWHTRRAFCTHK